MSPDALTLWSPILRAGSPIGVRFFAHFVDLKHGVRSGWDSFREASSDFGSQRSAKAFLTERGATAVHHSSRTRIRKTRIRKVC
jgi:hypothetical protein